MDERETERVAAVRRLKVRRGFRMHLGAYVITIATLVAIWAMGSRAGFWPAWPLIFWGAAVAFHGWWAYFGNPVSERAIRREMGGR
jgi:hypothetical protein